MVLAANKSPNSSGALDRVELLPSRILVPVDFSPASRKAVADAVQLAKRFSARLALIHVTHPKPRPSRYGVLEFAGLAIDRRQPAREKLWDFAESEIPEELNVARFVKSGRPYAQIVRAASDWKADLIVIPTHGYGGLAHAVIGSTAERVVRHAPCPVLVFRGRPGKDTRRFSAHAIQNILLPTDFSSNSLNAFPTAVAWAAHFGAKITLLYVVPAHFPLELSRIGVILEEKRAAETAAEQLPDFARMHLPSDLLLQTRVLIGAPGHAICESARKRNADLIILASHGHTGLERLTIGSVAERVVQHAACPVLVVRGKGLS